MSETSPSDASNLANRSGMDPRRLLAIFLLCSAVVLILFFDHVLGQIWAGIGWRDPEVIEGLPWHVSSVVGAVITLALVVGSYLYQPSRQFMLESASELMKVTWPTGSETRTSTWAVLVASVITALFLFAIDTLSYRVFVEWVPLLWEKL